MTVRQRIGTVAGLFGIPSRLMAYPRDEERETFDVHVFTDSGGRFRLGYFSGNAFFRENPIMRTLRRYGVSVREGAVGEGTEPQYDLRITFNDDGTVFSISDNRASMEAEF
jgi:hypothetical protein